MKKSLAHIGPHLAFVHLFVNFLISASVWWAVVIEGVGSPSMRVAAGATLWFLINVAFVLAIIDDEINE